MSQILENISDEIFEKKNYSKAITIIEYHKEKHNIPEMFRLGAIAHIKSKQYSKAKQYIGQLLPLKKEEYYLIAAEIGLLSKNYPEAITIIENCFDTMIVTHQAKLYFSIIALYANIGSKNPVEAAKLNEQLKGSHKRLYAPTHDIIARMQNNTLAETELQEFINSYIPIYQ